MAKRRFRATCQLSQSAAGQGRPQSLIWTRWGAWPRGGTSGKQIRRYAPGYAAGGLRKALHDLERSGIKLAIIDTPPFATAEVAAIVRVADLVIVPVIPSPHDLRAIGETIELVETEKKPLIFVVSNASINGKLTLQAVTALSQHGTVAPAIIHTRQDFRSAMIKGKTAGEAFPSSKSAAEISELWTYIAGRLKRVGEGAHGAAAN